MKNYFAEVSAVEARKEANAALEKNLERQKENLAGDIISVIRTNAELGNFSVRLVIKDSMVNAMDCLTAPLRERGFEVSLLRILKNKEDEEKYKYSAYHLGDDDDEYGPDENHMLVVTW